MEQTILPILGDTEHTVTTEIQSCNDITAAAGVTLEHHQIVTLQEGQKHILRQTGRVEFGSGILKELILKIYNSPYITPENYEETLFELQDAFYQLKNTVHDRLDDKELLTAITTIFNRYSHGAVEPICDLSEKALLDFCRNGKDPFATSTKGVCNDDSWK